MNKETHNDDLVAQDYWDKNWDASDLATALDISPGILKNPQGRRLHNLFHGFLSGLPKGTQLLEVGCANSYFLPYFATHYGFSVTGLDYSEKGCEQAKAILTREKVHGTIICSDMFTPPNDMREAFDIVVTFGVIEHFRPTIRVLNALKYFLRPGGLMITLIPNMNGLVGFVQKKVNRDIFDLHIPLTNNDLRAAHCESGFECLFSDYFTFANFYVVNPGNTSINLALRTLQLLTKAIWLLENITHPFPANRCTSPYIVCVARKK